jgi:hypothetical protein
MAPIGPFTHPPTPFCIISYNLTIIQERYTPDCLVLLPLHHHSKLEFNTKFETISPLWRRPSNRFRHFAWCLDNLEIRKSPADTFLISAVQTWGHPLLVAAVLYKGNIYWCVCTYTRHAALLFLYIIAPMFGAGDAVRLKLYSTFFVCVCLYLSVSVDRFHLATTTCVRSPADSYCFLTGLLW